jgi:hypothetical protein
MVYYAYTTPNAFKNARCRQRVRVLDLDPHFRPARPVKRAGSFRDDALKTIPGGSLKEFVAVTFGVFDVLDAAARVAQNPS